MIPRLRKQRCPTPRHSTFVSGAMKTALGGLALLLLLASCVTTSRNMPARLYSLADGRVIQATFSFAGSTGGEVRMDLPTGEILGGEYRTLRSGFSGWGAIFAQGGVSAGTVAVRSDQYRGTAIASGPRGTVIECEYVTSSSRSRPEGHGTCRDNGGQLYRLIF